MLLFNATPSSLSREPETPNFFLAQIFFIFPTRFLVHDSPAGPNSCCAANPTMSTAQAGPHLSVVAPRVVYLVPQAVFLDTADPAAPGDGAQQSHQVQQLAVHQWGVSENRSLEERKGEKR